MDHDNGWICAGTALGTESSLDATTGALPLLDGNEGNPIGHSVPLLAEIAQCFHAQCCPRLHTVPPVNCLEMHLVEADAYCAWAGWSFEAQTQW